MENFIILEEYFSFFKRIEYRDKEILYLDLADTSILESQNRVKKTYKIIESFPKESILIISDYTRVKYNIESITEMQKYAKHNKPYMKKSALIGIGGLKKVVVSKVITFAGRSDVKVFTEEKDALDWLVDY